MKIIILTGVLISLLFIVSPIIAAEYVFETGGNNNYQDAQKIDHPEKLKYVYGSISNGFGKADFYVLDFTDYSQQTEISLLVHKTGNAQYFKPSLIFLSPEDRYFSGSVMFALPPNLGGKDYKWEDFEENPASDDTVNELLVRGPTITRDLAPHRYYIAVYDPNSQAGDYVLKIGAKEDPFSWLNLPQIILAFVRVKLHLY